MTKKRCIFAANLRLGYGVMVTLQILVLPFLVRVRVAQLKKETCLQASFFVESDA